MRNIVAATVAATMFATGALAAADNTPLASGKPAGVKAAQMGDNNIWYIVAGGVVIAGIVLVASGSGNSSLTPGTPPTSTASTGTR